jgi:hypothetical protein
MMIVSVGDHYLTRFEWRAEDGEVRYTFAGLDELPSRIKDAILAAYRRNGRTGEVKLVCGGVQDEGGKSVHWVRSESA